MVYGRAYDFSTPFFTQFQKLSAVVPRPALYAINPINSEYCNQCKDVKNVYLSSSILNAEDVAYSYRVDKSQDLIDVSYAIHAERCFESVDIAHSHAVSFSRYAENCYDAAFLYDAKNVHDCFCCVNLRNTQYCIFNKRYTREEYAKERAKYDLGSWRVVQEVKEKFSRFASAFPRRHALLLKTDRVVGDNVYNAKNCFGCFDSYDMENTKYIVAGIDGIRDSYDLNHSGLHSELCYEGWSTIGLRVMFSISGFGQDIEYGEFCNNKSSSHLFGCISINTQKTTASSTNNTPKSPSINSGPKSSSICIRCHIQTQKAGYTNMASSSLRS
jgi:hypothetical protein